MSRPVVNASALSDFAAWCAAWSSWTRTPPKSCPKLEPIESRVSESSGRPALVPNCGDESCAASDDPCDSCRCTIAEASEPGGSCTPDDTTRCA